LLGFAACALTIAAIGCGGEKKEETGNVPSTAPVNNNAPEAKNAQAAPRDPSIVMPGGGGGGKKKMGPPGGAP